jgi:hypothetical protein
MKGAPAMNLNQLIHREGVERLRAVHAACDPSREAHLRLAELYRDRIDGRRRGSLRDAAGLAPALALVAPGL